jgi:hypothetical protein
MERNRGRTEYNDVWLGFQSDAGSLPGISIMLGSWIRPRWSFCRCNGCRLGSFRGVFYFYQVRGVSDSRALTSHSFLLTLIPNIICLSLYEDSFSSDQTSRLCAPWKKTHYRSWHEIARPQLHGYDMECIAFSKSHQYISGAEEKVNPTCREGNFTLPSAPILSLFSRFWECSKRLNHSWRDFMRWPVLRRLNAKWP